MNEGYEFKPDPNVSKYMFKVLLVCIIASTIIITLYNLFR